jgi:Leucine-rich repeat (LRR) protein
MEDEFRQPAAFLDTIPEDQSVAAVNTRAGRVPNPPPSSASAVASSDSGADGDTTNKRGGRGPQSVLSGVSETPALLEGGLGTEQSPSRRIRRPTCTKRTYMFYGMLSLLLVAITVGIYFIIHEASFHSENGSLSPFDPSAAPTTITFPPFPFAMEIESESPTASPSLNLADTEAIDNALFKISDSSDVYDDTTAQGKCRYWLTHQELTASLVGEDAVHQRYILCVLYYATNGPFWTEPFLDKQIPECDWEGVSCYNESVAAIYLPSFNLNGGLPDELMYLQNLKLLNLGNNSLTGSIPLGLFSLPALIWCNLSQNSLQGVIPRGGSPLQHLYLNQNQLEGVSPYFPTLQVLWMQRNFLTGLEARYASSSTLTDYRVYGNLFSGALPTTWDAPKLWRLDLAWNSWTGTIPDSLWNDLPSLETLALHDGNLTGTIPVTTGNGPRSMKHLWLYSNELSGSLPALMGWDWQNLTDMLLHDNYLTGAVEQRQCERWPALKRLETDCDQVDCACCTKCYDGPAG